MGRLFVVGVGLILLILLGSTIGPYLILASTKTTFTDTVKEKWIKAPQGSTGQKYMISTLNHGVLEDTDQWMFLKFNSADVYAEIDPGKCYTFTVVGWRMPILSYFPNILEVGAC